MALEKEWETYQRELPKLLAQTGKFVLVKEDAIVDHFDTYDDAIKAGYEKFGLDPFMVKQINGAEPAQFFMRSVEIPCHI